MAEIILEPPPVSSSTNVRVQNCTASETGGLLRVLFLRVGEVSADAVPWLLWIDEPAS
jgi:hypothetical protein